MIPLTQTGIMHEVDVAGDTDASLEMKPETLTGLKNLVGEAYALFGARHYRNYRFLLTLSDHGGSEGLEHHESVKMAWAKAVMNSSARLPTYGPRIYSWNGKYRRPAGLLSPT
jgi:predicted metalloprotease with PDZ domain